MKKKLLLFWSSGKDQENGEFHTCVYAGPMFKKEIQVTRGETAERDGFCFCDLLPVVAAVGAV